MNVVKEIQRINEKEAALGLSGDASWHSRYKDSAYIFVGGLDFDLTEGDILAVFCQYGEIVDINLVKDKSNGKSKGFCFICYEDQRSTILAVDNFNGTKLCGRTLRVDHVAKYKLKKDNDVKDEEGNFVSLEERMKKVKKERRQERREQEEKEKNPENPEPMEGVPIDQLRAKLEEHAKTEKELPKPKDEREERSSHRDEKRRRSKSRSRSRSRSPRRDRDSRRHRSRSRDRDRRRSKSRSRSRSRDRYRRKRSYSRSRSRSRDRHRRRY